jgi:hypothetical protein
MQCSTHNELPPPGVPQEHVVGVTHGGKLVGLARVPCAAVHIVRVTLPYMYMSHSQISLGSGSQNNALRNECQSLALPAPVAPAPSTRSQHPRTERMSTLKWICSSPVRWAPVRRLWPPPTPHTSHCPPPGHSYPAWRPGSETRRALSRPPPQTSCGHYNSGQITRGKGGKNTCLKHDITRSFAQR